MLSLGYVEHELTRLSAGATLSRRNASPPLSVFVQMLLNPDNMQLERLTPVAFKVVRKKNSYNNVCPLQKARIELRKALQELNDIKKNLPYNFELALTVAEVQLVTELMILASRCVIRPSLN